MRRAVVLRSRERRDDYEHEFGRSGGKDFDGEDGHIVGSAVEAGEAAGLPEHVLDDVMGGAVGHVKHGLADSLTAELLAIEV